MCSVPIAVHLATCLNVIIPGNCVSVRAGATGQVGQVSTRPLFSCPEIF